MSNGASAPVQKARPTISGPVKTAVSAILTYEFMRRALSDEDRQHKDQEVLEEQMSEELKWVHAGEKGLERDLGAVKGPSQQELSSLCSQLENALGSYQDQPDQADKIAELRSRIDRVEGQVKISTTKIEEGRAQIETERAGATPMFSVSRDVDKKEPGLLGAIMARSQLKTPKATEVTTTRTEITRVPSATSVAGEGIDDSVAITEETTKSMIARLDAKVRKRPIEEARTLAHELKAAEDSGDSQTAAKLSKTLGKVMEEHHLSPDVLRTEMPTAEATMKERELERPPETEEQSKTNVSIEATHVEASRFDLKKESKVSAHLRERVVAGEPVLESVAAQEGVVAEMEYSHHKLEEAYASAIEGAKGLMEYLSANPDNKDVKYLRTYIQKIHKKYGLIDEVEILTAAIAIAEVDQVNMQTEEGTISPIVAEDIELCAEITTDLKAKGVDATLLQVVDVAKSIVDDKNHPSEYLHEVLVKPLFGEQIKEKLSGVDYSEQSGELKRAA